MSTLWAAPVGNREKDAVNRLGAATSPYLLQHAGNPVDWWEWGEDAFAEARRRHVPVLLSVGYSACHWCHVMAHESFEDQATADYLNAHFVSVKVDREERPDVDAVYMQATTAMTGHGGWPMTCVLDHEGSPFFAGTYFPERARGGMPAFRQVLEAVVEAWEQRSDDVRRVAADLREHLRREATTVSAPIDAAVLDAAVTRLGADFDPAHAGFGGAPKFPPSMSLEQLLRHARRTGSPAARKMLDATCEAMARGGIYDQLAGGFARYSVDRAWVVPHFEKMLYDNAQLLGVYARWGGPLGERVAAETADFLVRELGTAEGGFAAALDADSEGEEGRFYVWTPEQLAAALGPGDGAWAAEVFEVTAAGTFEHGASTLQLLGEPDDLDRLADVRARLLAVRADRVRPARDDKVVAAWNGLAIASMCDAGRLLGRQDLVEGAVRAGTLLADLHLHDDGSLLRVSRDGRAGRHRGVLEDHGCVAGGFLALAGVTGDAAWLTRARSVLDHALDRFRASDGGFYDTADDAEALVARPRDPADNASPSGTSAMIHALVTAAGLTGEGRYRQAAEEALATVAALAVQAPRFAGWSLAAAEALAAGPLEVALVGPSGPARDALERAARSAAGVTVVVADAGDNGIPLLDARGPVGGDPAAYVCREMVCERPVTTVDELAALLA
jgi:uncharacterized protein YyaL (SSP411 family)